jgi:signal peptidase II
MIAKHSVKIILVLFVIIVNIGCDQASKKIIRQNLNPNEAIHLLSNHVTITRVENSGAFLSFGESLPTAIKSILLSLLPFVALTLGLFYVLTKQSFSNVALIGFCFMIGGGIGNLFDRVVHGSVTDFLHINFWFFQTGIFNMADLSIMTGLCVIAYHLSPKRNFTK